MRKLRWFLTQEENRMLILIFGSMILLIVGLIVFAILSSDLDEWKESCVTQNGRVLENSSTIVSFGSDGKPSYGVSTTYFCLNEQGGIIDIYE